MIVRLVRFQERELTVVVGRRSAEEDSSEVSEPENCQANRNFPAYYDKKGNYQIT